MSEEHGHYYLISYTAIHKKGQYKGTITLLRNRQSMPLWVLDRVTNEVKNESDFEEICIQGVFHLGYMTAEEWEKEQPDE